NKIAHVRCGRIIQVLEHDSLSRHVKRIAMVEVTANKGKDGRFRGGVSKRLDIFCESVGVGNISQDNKVKGSLTARDRECAKGRKRRRGEWRDSVNDWIEIDGSLGWQAGKRDHLGKVTRGVGRVSL